MILKLGMQHWGLEVYEVYMTYFTPRSNLAVYTFEWKKTFKVILNKGKIAAND